MKYNISQIPVTKGNEFVGGLNDSFLFTKLMANPELKNEKVSALMQSAFPFVSADATIDEISKKITKECNAVLVKDLAGDTHIITKHDIIEALA